MFLCKKRSLVISSFPQITDSNLLFPLVALLRTPTEDIAIARPSDATRFSNVPFLKQLSKTTFLNPFLKHFMCFIELIWKSQWTRKEKEDRAGTWQKRPNFDAASRPNNGRSKEWKNTSIWFVTSSVNTYQFDSSRPNCFVARLYLTSCVSVPQSQVKSDVIIQTSDG